MQPRTSPLQKIPSRPARAKHSLKSKISSYSIRGADAIPGYLAMNYPGQDADTYRAMHNALDIWMDTHPEQVTVPTPAQLNHLGIFEGLI